MKPKFGIEYLGSGSALCPMVSSKLMSYIKWNMFGGCWWIFLVAFLKTCLNHILSNEKNANSLESERIKRASLLLYKHPRLPDFGKFQIATSNIISCHKSCWHATTYSWPKNTTNKFNMFFSYQGKCLLNTTSLSDNWRCSATSSAIETEGGPFGEAAKSLVVWSTAHDLLRNVLHGRFRQPYAKLKNIVGTAKSTSNSVLNCWYISVTESLLLKQPMLWSLLDWKIPCLHPGHGKQQRWSFTICVSMVLGAETRA